MPDNGKAEIVNGELVVIAPTGFLPNRASFNITATLGEYEHRTKSGFAFADNAGFKVNLPHRESLSPDAAFYVGKTSGMKFFQGAPVFAAEVRPRWERQKAGNVSLGPGQVQPVPWRVRLTSDPGGLRVTSQNRFVLQV